MQVQGIWYTPQLTLWKFESCLSPAQERINVRPKQLETREQHCFGFSIYSVLVSISSLQSIEQWLAECESSTHHKMASYQMIRNNTLQAMHLFLNWEGNLFPLRTVFIKNKLTAFELWVLCFLSNFTPVMLNMISIYSSNLYMVQ
jgi:hypothetical protein